MRRVPEQWQCHEFSLGLWLCSEVWETVPMGSRVEAPIVGLGDHVPQKLKQCRHCLQILTAETIKILNCRII